MQMRQTNLVDKRYVFREIFLPVEIPSILKVVKLSCFICPLISIEQY